MVLVEKLHQLILCGQIATVVISVATTTETILAQSQNFQILKKKKHDDQNDGDNERRGV